MSREWRDHCDREISEAVRNAPFNRVDVEPMKAALIRGYAARFAVVGGPFTVLEELRADGVDVSWDEVRSLVEPN